MNFNAAARGIMRFMLILTFSACPNCKRIQYLIHDNLLAYTAELQIIRITGLIRKY